MKISKKYKRLRWAQWILFISSFVACIIPVVVYAIVNCSIIKEAESRWALGGVVIFMLAVIALIVLRSYIRKYIQNLPCTLGILIAVVVMLLFVICLEKIIDEVKAMLVVECISAAVAFVLELSSICFKNTADQIREFYLHGKYEEPKEERIDV